MEYKNISAKLQVNFRPILWQGIIIKNLAENIKL